MKKRKGFTYVDTLASVILLMALIFAVGTLQLFMSMANVKMEEKAFYIESLNNTIAETYDNNDWTNFTDKTINKGNKDMFVSYEYVGINYDENIEIIRINIDFDEKNEFLILERSVN